MSYVRLSVRPSVILCNVGGLVTGGSLDLGLSLGACHDHGHQCSRIRIFRFFQISKKRAFLRFFEMTLKKT